MNRTLQTYLFWLAMVDAIAGTAQHDRLGATLCLMVGYGLHRSLTKKERA